jgi:hypothetical protein
MYWLDPIPRSYPAAIPQLSRNYPATIPQLSRNYPATIPQLSRNYPATTRNYPATTPQRAQVVSAQAVPKHAEDSVLYELRALHIIRQRVINA